jgi:adenosylcobinamide-GDP ribazoletransferase
MIARFVTAWSFLTVVPLGGGATRREERDFAQSLVAFPVVGLVLGIAVAGLYTISAWVFPLPLAVVLSVLGLVCLTGGLHLDGVADTADALGARTREDALRIMKGSTIGTFGALALVSVLGLKIAGLLSLPAGAHVPALIAMPVVGRWVQTELVVGWPYAREVGTAKVFIQSAGVWQYLIATSMALPIVAVVFGWAGLIATAVVGGVVALYGWLVARWLGGVTGDTIGAAGEGAEVVALLTWAALFHASNVPGGIFN